MILAGTALSTEFRFRGASLVGEGPLLLNGVPKPATIPGPSIPVIPSAKWRGAEGKLSVASKPEVVAEEARTGRARERLRGWLKWLRAPRMGLVLGADACRYVLSGRETVFSEPAILWRHLVTGRVLLAGHAIGPVASHTGPCRMDAPVELMHPFFDGRGIDSFLLTSMFRYFRRRAAEKGKCRKPSRLAVTARPGLLECLQPLVERCARAAGFRRASTVEEQVCLGLAAEVRPDAPTLVVDLGHCGARVYAWLDGQPAPRVATTMTVAGVLLIGAIQRRLRQTYGMDTGQMMVRRLVANHALDLSPLEAKGRDLASGNPARKPIPGGEITAIEEGHFRPLVELCRSVLPAQGVGPVRSLRVVLAGAGSACPVVGGLLQRSLPGLVELPPQADELSARGLPLDGKRDGRPGGNYQNARAAPPQP